MRLLNNVATNSVVIPAERRQAREPGSKCPGASRSSIAERTSNTGGLGSRIGSLARAVRDDNRCALCSPIASRAGSLPPGQDQAVGRWQVEARLDAEHGGDAGDHLAGGRAGVPAGGGEAERLLEPLRLVQDDEDLIARLVGRQDGGEGGQELGLGIAAANHLLGGAGLAPDVVALDVGLGG